MRDGEEKKEKKEREGEQVLKYPFFKRAGHAKISQKKKLFVGACAAGSPLRSHAKPFPVVINDARLCSRPRVDVGAVSHIRWVSTIRHDIGNPNFSFAHCNS